MTDFKITGKYETDYPIAIYQTFNYSIDIQFLYSKFLIGDLIVEVTPIVGSFQGIKICSVVPIFSGLNILCEKCLRNFAHISTNKTSFKLIFKELVFEGAENAIQLSNILRYFNIEYLFKANLNKYNYQFSSLSIIGQVLNSDILLESQPFRVTLKFNELEIFSVSNQKVLFGPNIPQMNDSNQVIS